MGPPNDMVHAYWCGVTGRRPWRQGIDTRTADSHVQHWRDILKQEQSKTTQLPSKLGFTRNVDTQHRGYQKIGRRTNSSPRHKWRDK